VPKEQAAAGAGLVMLAIRAEGAGSSGRKPRDARDSCRIEQAAADIGHAAVTS